MARRGLNSHHVPHVERELFGIAIEALATVFKTDLNDVERLLIGGKLHVGEPVEHVQLVTAAVRAGAIAFASPWDSLLWWMSTNCSS